MRNDQQEITVVDDEGDSNDGLMLRKEKRKRIKFLGISMKKLSMQLY